MCSGPAEGFKCIIEWQYYVGNWPSLIAVPRAACSCSRPVDQTSTFGRHDPHTVRQISNSPRPHSMLARASPIPGFIWALSQASLGPGLTVDCSTPKDEAIPLIMCHDKRTPALCFLMIKHASISST